MYIPKTLCAVDAIDDFCHTSELIFVSAFKHARAYRFETVLIKDNVVKLARAEKLQLSEEE